MKLRDLVLCLFGTLIFSLAAAGQTVSGEIKGGVVKRGQPVKAVVTLDLPSELHVNSNRPTEAYLIPTTVIPTAPGLKLGLVKFPDAHDRKFAFSEKPLNIFEGKVTFLFDVTVPKTFKSKKAVVDVAVRYQACTEEVCYPPKTKQVKLEAEVR